MPNEGMLQFRPAPGEWGTELTLTLRFNPPGGKIGKKSPPCSICSLKSSSARRCTALKARRNRRNPHPDGQPAGRHDSRKDEEA